MLFGARDRASGGNAMSRRMRKLLVVCAGAGLAMFAIGSSTALAADVLQNGGLEVGGGGPAVWTLTQTVAPLGDFNGDNTVDAADYVMWRKGGPLFNEVSTLSTATPEDYADWRAHY